MTQSMNQTTVFEVCLLSIKPGMEAEFEAGVRQAAPLFRRAKGCLSMELRRFVENPCMYHLLVQWNSLEAHTVDFRASEDFQKWRSCVSHCFAAPPEVIHTIETLQGF